MNEPVCLNHPDRPGVSHYGRPYAYSLCLECRNKRLAYLDGLPLDETAARIIPPKDQWPEDTQCLTR
jgi:hypothetical protein